MDRSSGILMHITSLPSPYGTGTLGAEAYRFVDFLKKSGQKYWQLLPVNPAGYGNSPYMSYSTFAGDPIMIDLDMLAEEGLLADEEYKRLDWGSDPLSLDFDKVCENKMQVLSIAAERSHGKELPDFAEFCEQNHWWLEDYAVYMAAKYVNGGQAWDEWEDKELIRHSPEAVKAFARKHTGEVYYWRFVQYLFYQQWAKLKEYAKLFGVGLIGDIPFYVSADSADVWANRKLFWFDDDHKPSYFAGCPPDSFSEEGQFWGNPVYDWEYMKEDGYGWWVSRIEYMSRLFDMIRVDHFRGFEAFYSISRETRKPADGQWNEGPGSAFFDVVRQKLGDVSIIAEDLGFLTPEVHEMREASGYPGMKVLQFAFDSREGSDYLPHNYERDDVVYTGTHDNTTLAGWFEEAPEQDVRRAVEYAALTEDEGYCWGMLRLMYGSVAWLAIAQLQDFLELPGSARMNTPSTMGINWKWRVGADYDKPGLGEKIMRMVKLYGRH